jgi:hypothetical protein
MMRRQRMLEAWSSIKWAYVIGGAMLAAACANHLPSNASTAPPLGPSPNNGGSHNSAGGCQTSGAYVNGQGESIGSCNSAPASPLPREPIGSPLE